MINTLRAAAVFIAGFATFLNLYTPQAFLPTLAADLHVTPTQVGLSLTVTLLAVAIMAPIAGGISDRFGRKNLIVGACALVILPTLLVAASRSLPALLAWRFVQGMLLPFIFTVTVAYVADECPGADMIRVSGLYSSGTIFGGFLGRFIGGIVADLAGWRAVFVVLAAITALAAGFVAWAMPPEQRFTPIFGGPGATIRAYGEHIRNKRLLATCAIGFGMLFCTVACFTFVNFHLAAPPFLLSPAHLALVFAVYLVGMIMAPLATRAAAVIGRPRALHAALLAAAAGMLLTLNGSLAIIITGLALAVGGLMVVQALSIGFIGAAVSRARSSAVGLYVTVFYIGGAIGGVAPGAVWHVFGWPGVVGLIVAIIAAMALIGAIAWRPLAASA